ncbi:MAG TPA: hypothetical protein VKF60_03650 [Myxococcota bacterium]|nr:hypothetical protein [Myxococcota bacterium]
MEREAERERLEQNIADDRTELRRALRDLGVSVFFALDLPRRIRRRPLPWAIGVLGVAAFLIVRREQRKGARRRSHWWARARAQD